MKPMEGGAPAIETQAATAAAKVTGMAFARPPRALRSRVPVDFSIVPATRNSAALYSACATRKASATRIPGHGAPGSAGGGSPRNRTQTPSAMTVVQASTCFMSVLPRATNAEYAAVTAPAAVRVSIQSAVPPSTGVRRASRNTPALTIVAECRKAETGVGAAIAFGSQKWNGNCADFVNAPSRIRTTIDA